MFYSIPQISEFLKFEAVSKYFDEKFSMKEFFDESRKHLTLLILEIYWFSISAQYVSSRTVNC